MNKKWLYGALFSLTIFVSLKSSGKDLYTSRCSQNYRNAFLFFTQNYGSKKYDPRLKNIAKLAKAYRASSIERKQAFGQLLEKIVFAALNFKNVLATPNLETFEPQIFHLAEKIEKLVNFKFEQGKKLPKFISMMLDLCGDLGKVCIVEQDFKQHCFCEFLIGTVLMPVLAQHHSVEQLQQQLEQKMCDRQPELFFMVKLAAKFSCANFLKVLSHFGFAQDY